MSTDRFARRCDVTGKGMNEGFVIGDGFHIAEEEDLIAHLRTLDSEFEINTSSMNDEQLKQYFYNEEYYYWTEWEELDEDYYYTKDGEEISTL